MKKVLKPSIAIFFAKCPSCGAEFTYEKDDMLIIGDELDKDVLGGIKNGIDSCWFNMNNTANCTNYKPMYEIASLMELKNIL